VPENGIDLSRFPPPANRSPESYRNRPLRAVFLGRLVPYKGAAMLLEAAAPLLADGRLTLDIIGFGPEREPLEQLAARLGLAERIVFSGKISHHDVAARFSQADVLTFPSVHEFGGAVVLEAMAMGVVPIVVNYGGPAELVSPASGFAIPLGTREQIVADLRDVLQRIVQSPHCLAPMSTQATRRARELFSWPAKARQTLEVYRWVLGRRATKPDLELPFADPVASMPSGQAPAESLAV
jgi:glycosyltransferase involved in cell wall biosynthesis